MYIQSRFPFLQRSALVILFLGLHAFSARAQNTMILSHNDISRTGWNPNETYLAPSNVNTAADFGKLFSQPVDGQVFTQPLYVPNLSIAGGTHNVVFIATEHESVYAFDADASQAPLWQVNFGGVVGGTTVSSVPYAETASCNDIGTEFGITGTPAIDLSTNTLYVTAETKEVAAGPVTNYVHRLHALNLSTGAEKFGGPVTIQAAVTVNGSIATFNAPQQLNRPGLVLSNGIVYSFWGSHCDDGLYYGWVLGYSASNLSLQKVFNAAPVSQSGAIWACGEAPPIDSNGNFYLTTANGSFDVNTGGVDYCDSVIKLSSSSMAVGDYFTPADQAFLDDNDEDFGAVGAVLLPGSFGSAAHPRLLTCGDKTGVIYLLDMNNLGGYLNGAGGTDAVVQEFQGASTTITSGYTIPSCYNGTVYWGFVGDPIRAYNFVNGQYPATANSLTPESYDFPGAMPSVSSNGNTNGILWAIQPGTTATLIAYDATNLANELYNSNNVAADGITFANNKFTPPTIINGKVYVATSGSMEVFGLKITVTPFPTPSGTQTPTKTPTSTPSPTVTSTATSTATFTPAITFTPTLTGTATISPTPTATLPPGSGPVIAVPNILKDGQTVATFRVPESGASLEVSIYDIDGEKLVEGQGAPGSSLCYWNSAGSASGLYLARVKVTDADGNTRSQSLKLVVLH